MEHTLIIYDYDGMILAEIPIITAEDMDSACDIVECFPTITEIDVW